MTTKRMSNASRLGILALALTLVTTCLLGGTLAKYTTEVTGDGTATVATWSFKANGETATMADVDLASTLSYSNVAKDRIAPGTEGSFAIKVDAAGSETDVDYTIAFSELQNKPTNLKFYSDADRKTEITDLATATGLGGTIKTGDTTKEVTKTVYWKWAIDSGDAADTTNGEAANKMTFKITVKGTQATPTPTTA